MPRFTRFAAFLSVVILLVASPAFAQDSPPPVETLELAEGDCLVFLGDSITHQCLYTQYVEDFFYTRYPGKRIQFHNAGVGGAKAWDALQRFQKDVAAYNPKYVTVLLGMNDGLYQPFDQQTFDTYEQDMTKVMERIKQTGATPILMTPTMYDSRVGRATERGDADRWEYYNSVMSYYGTWLRDVAYQNGYGMVDMWSPLNNITLEQRQEDPDFTLIPDAVHPGPGGQIVMAYAVLEDMNLAGPLSTIRINTRDKQANHRAKGGKLSELKQTESGLSFTWQADALPFVIPKEARLGVELLHLGRRTSRETLAVAGLVAGRYELLIDGEVVGKYRATRLAGGIQLQDNQKTPQYQQALQVADLNKKRNDGPVHTVRGEWHQFQAYARTKRQAAEQPDNEQIAKRLKELKQTIEDMEVRVEKAEAEAKAIVDEIYKVNQPKPHEYELRWLGGQANKSPKDVANSLHGTVTLNGKPLANATVVFEGDGKSLTAKTDKGATYSVTNQRIPVGNYEVTISGQRVPRKYSRTEKSPLTVTIVDDENEIDFELATP